MIIDMLNMDPILDLVPEASISEQQMFITEIIKSSDHLPKVQVRALQFKVHISSFLRKCKKGKSPKKDLPHWKKDIIRLFIDMKRTFYCSNLQSTLTKKAGPFLTLPV